MRLVLLTADSITAAGFAQIIPPEGSFELIAVADGLVDLTLLIEMAPAVLLIDWGPNMSIQTLTRIQSILPCCKTVLWMTETTVDFAHCVIQMNVRGIMRRDLPVKLILQCLQKVASGGLWFESSITDSLLTARPVRLSPRERQLVKLISEGLSNKEIAVSLSISEGTVKAYLSKLFKKLRVKHRFELAIYSLRTFQSAHVSGDDAYCPRSVLVREGQVS